ncbi:carboxymuconolactone decarboxylase family protein [Salininema proteolyticum]|uniref:Carboxymuconolactone decarboxylase-like domain-containing protein n=1 Tax=Salininema proteolyticum TaxID=1607685 RepID=A0ABV8U4U7_9ACTN
MNARVQHVTPVRPSRAEGPVAAVYSRSETELGTAGPVVRMLSPAPELLAPVWSLLRESLLVGGPAERVGKEVVALTVSLRNGCSFCTAAHAGFLDLLTDDQLGTRIAKGEDPAEYAALTAWARDPSGPPPCEPGEVPRYTGTLLAKEVVTRFVDVLVAPGDPSFSSPSQEAAFYASVKAALARDLVPGESLAEVNDLRERLENGLWGDPVRLTPNEPAWAAGSPVGSAYAHFQAVAGMGRRLMSPEAAVILEERVAEDASEIGDAARYLPAQARRGLEIAFSSGQRPHAITAGLMEEWRRGDMSDHCALFVMAFGIGQALRRMEKRVR